MISSIFFLSLYLLILRIVFISGSFFSGSNNLPSLHLKIHDHVKAFSFTLLSANSVANHSPQNHFSNARENGAASLFLKSGFSQVFQSTGFRTAVAGALAGAVTTGLLHPLDTVKTLRQANCGFYKSSFSTIQFILRTEGVKRLYAGLLPAVILSMPASALYFGTYETMKKFLAELPDKANHIFLTSMFKISGVRYAISAACGNTASSLVFVPKEFIKQSMQAGQADVSSRSMLGIVCETVQKKGFKGLYAGYFATLSRNIPSAILRFTLYEEFRRVLALQQKDKSPALCFVAGALAGIVSSGITTPLDVVKTKVATGRLSRSLSLWEGLCSIARQEGINSLYAGLYSRMIMAGLFTAIGFGSFEAFKKMLGADAKKTSSFEVDAKTGDWNKVKISQ